MKTRRIFIALRGLRFGGGADLGGDGRNQQRCHGEKRYRCFIYGIVHAGYVASLMPSRLERRLHSREVSAFLRQTTNRVAGEDSVNIPLSNHETLGLQNRPHRLPRHEFAPPIRCKSKRPIRFIGSLRKHLNAHENGSGFEPQMGLNRHGRSAHQRWAKNHLTTGHFRVMHWS